MIRTKVRRSRKTRWCQQDFAHDYRIKPGDLYGIHVASPTDPEVGTGRWQSMTVCLGCAHDNAPHAVLDYFIRDRKGIALVAAIHQRKASSEQETQDHQREPSSPQA